MSEQTLTSPELTMRRNRRRTITIVFCVACILYAIWSLSSSKPKEDATDAPSLEEVNVAQDEVAPDHNYDDEAMHVMERRSAESVFLLYITSTQADALQNIILRKAINDNLKVALPRVNKETLCFPRSYESTCALNKNDSPYNIMVHQVMYEKQVLKPVLQVDAKFVAMVRHPIAHLQAAYYDNEWSHYANGQPFGYFITNKYNQFSRIFDFDKKLPYRNIQLFSFGFPPTHYDNRDAVIQQVSSIIRDYDVILIQERMMESLVLLKDELYWSTEELVTFSLQSRPENYELAELTRKVNETIVLHNEADMRMYEMLLEEFERRISEIGEERMQAEKTELQNAINKETEHCLKKSEEEMKEPAMRIEYSLSWEGESDRYCHYHISRGSELTTLLRLAWEKKDRQRRKKYELKPLNGEHN